MQKESPQITQSEADEMWGIQDFSEIFDITPRALRFYETKGLLSPSRESGSRVFGIEDRTRLERILRAKRLGFSLDDIKVVLDVADGVTTRREDLEDRRQRFERVIKTLKKRRKDIEILTVEMRELCDLIEDHLENTEPDADVVNLAQAYHQAFSRHRAHESGFDNDND